MKKHSHTAVLAALALAACQQQAPANVANNDPATPINAALPPTDHAAANAGNGVASPPPPRVALDRVTLPPRTRIPDHFQGRWGLNKADCTSTRSDAKGLLTISDVRLTFYEARGTLEKVIGATDTSFAARYSFSGEGQSWMRTERFALVKAELHRTTDAEPGQEPPVNLTYTRCPG
ncbi:hypothetical protein [Sphingomonas sp. RB1R13]|uniref:hypothetical protein n=1 Tax=Sphingomonas sp. RB1R13 TaxID=3096159 RepID=UPI002FCBF722